MAVADVVAVTVVAVAVVAEEEVTMRIVPLLYEPKQICSGM